jgi:hypothetical protein
MVAKVRKVKKGGVSFSSREEEPPTRKRQTVETAELLAPSSISFETGHMEFEMSEDITELVKAFISFREACPNPTKNRQGYNYNYVDIANIIENTTPLLCKNGLAVSQFPVCDGSHVNSDTQQTGDLDAVTRNTTQNRGLGVITLLMHKSGPWIRSRFTMPAPSMQGINWTQEAGACITYARRYALSATLCIAAEDDTDAATDEEPVQTRRKKRRA